MMFCGQYLGTVKENGFFWSPPFVNREFISLKYRNFETPIIKVNDSTGNPIKISAVFLWRIENTAKAFFDIQDINSFVASQSETSIRKLASSFPYDLEHHDTNRCLRGGGHAINTRLVEELQLRLNRAGIKVKDARINGLSYSEEIAQIMLRRQQADAVISARTKIVNGGVGIVAVALQSLKENEVCDMNREEKVKLASNLLTVIVSENSGESHQNKTSSSSNYGNEKSKLVSFSPLAPEDNYNY